MQPDFASQKSALEELVESMGASFLLLPPSHPELNPIERLWSQTKGDMGRQGKTKHKAVRSGIDAALHKRVRGPKAVNTIRKCSGKSKKYEAAYRAGLETKVAFDVAKRCSHRKATDVKLEDLLEKVAPDKKQRKKLGRELADCCFCDQCEAKSAEHVALAE